MSFWVIEPRDPIVVRDGRPNSGRSQSAGIPFPFPSTVAGMIRTRLGSDECGVFDPHQDLDRLLRVAVRGPLLMALPPESEPQKEMAPRLPTLYVPPPRDLRVERGRIRRLVPTRATDAVFDGGLETMPVGVAHRPEDSPGQPSDKHKDATTGWWPWDLLNLWLAEPDTLDGTSAQENLAAALPALPIESRLHVAIGDTSTSKEGMLYSTEGLRFVTPQRQSLAIACDIDTSPYLGRDLREGIAPGAGKRRLVRWKPAPSSMSLPSLPERVEMALAGKEAVVRVRIIVLTPAIFAAGWRPGAEEGQLLGRCSGVEPSLVAACVPRPETLSGWDFAKRVPKGSRRAVSAGSVYWLDIRGTPKDRVRWAQETMMRNVSDAEQDRRDGFGLAAIGVAS